MAEFYERGGNLYKPGTLQGNWYEDREQGTVGSNDGLRCAQMAYKEMMEAQDIYHGPTQEISMPASEFGQVSTQTRSVNLFPCTKYRHPKQLPTSRVLANYGVPPELRMTTTAMLMHHGEKRVYTGHPKRGIIDSTNMRECLKARPVSKAEGGFGAILPRYTTDLDLGVRYFQTSSRADFGPKVQPHATMTSGMGSSGGRTGGSGAGAGGEGGEEGAGATGMSGTGGGGMGGGVPGTMGSTGWISHCDQSHHPVNPHPCTVEEINKGTVEDSGAGFTYEESMSFNPTPFPTKGMDGGDPWGRSKKDKKGLFGAKHITSTSRMFIDARGQDMARLGITIPGDTTMWERVPGMPKPSKRKCIIAYAPKDNQTRRTGPHIWDDYEGIPDPNIDWVTGRPVVFQPRKTYEVALHEAPQRL